MEVACGISARWGVVCVAVGAEAWRHAVGGEVGEVAADCGVVEALGAGRFFLQTNGDTPHSLMVILKQGLGKHIKANAYSYRQAIDREEARIQRVGDLKDRAFQALWAVFAAAWIALFGFIGRIAWAEWGGDIVGEVLSSSAAD